MSRVLTRRDLAAIDPTRLGPDSPLRELLKPRRRAKDREHEEQVKLFAWADAQSIQHPSLNFLFAVPNWFGVRTAKQGARAKSEGRKKGCPDVWLPVSRGGYHGLVIEMKAGENRPTHDQRRWLAFLASAGWRTVVAFSADEAIVAVTDYLDG